MEFEDYQKAQENKDAKKYAWIRHIILMASGSLSVLISLHKYNTGTTVEHILFSASVALLGAGILTASIALYGEVHLEGLKVKHTGEVIIKQRKGEQTYGISFLDMPKVFKVCEILCYSFLILSVISLVLYTII